MSVAMQRSSRYTTRGVVFIHGAPTALCPHIVWAIEAVLDQRIAAVAPDDPALVIFSSDNGYMWSDHGRTEKFVP